MHIYTKEAVSVNHHSEFFIEIEQIVHVCVRSCFRSITKSCITVISWRFIFRDPRVTADPFAAAELQQADEARAPAEHFDNAPAQDDGGPGLGRILEAGRLELEELVRHLRDLRRVHQGPGTAEEPHAVDTQGEDTPEDDLQQAAAELPEVSVQVLHRSGTGEASARVAWVGHVEHAGGG